MIMNLGKERYGITHYIAKISTKNIPSIRMFEDKLCFKKVIDSLSLLTIVSIAKRNLSF